MKQCYVIPAARRGLCIATLIQRFKVGKERKRRLACVDLQTPHQGSNGMNPEVNLGSLPLKDKEHLRGTCGPSPGRPLVGKLYFPSASYDS